MPDVTAQESSEIPEAPTAEAPSPVLADEATENAQDTADASQAQPRDEHGRFTEKEKSEQVSDDAPAVDAEIQAAPIDGPPATEAPTSVQEPEFIAESIRKTREPFRFRAERSEHVLQDAEYYPGKGLFIPDSRVPEVKQLFAEGVTHRQSWRQTLESVRQESTGRVQEAEARANALNTAAVKLLDAIEQSGQFDEREINLLKRDLALDLRTAGLQKPVVRQEAEPDGQQAEVIQQQARSVLEDEVLTALAHNPKYSALAKLGEEDRKDLLSFFSETLPAYFDEQEGQIVLDRHKVLAALDRELKKVSRISEAQAEANRKAEALRKAAAQNELRNKKPVIPPAVPTKGSPTPSEGPRVYKTREEWQREMGLM